MNQDFSQTQIIAGLCGAGIILLFVLSILYDIIVKLIRKCKTTTKEGDPMSLDIKALIYTNIFLIFCHMATTLGAFMFATEDHHCAILGRIGVVLLHTLRSIIYLICVRRIQVIYTDTVFQLNKKHVFVLYIILFIYYVPYASYFDWNAVNGTYSLEYGCVGHIESSMVTLICIVIVFLLDITISIYGLYLFVYPLHRVMSLQDDKQVNYKLFNVMTKYLILGTFAIASSFIFFGITYFFNYGYYYVLIDDLLNGFVLILLHPIHNRLYKGFCCIPYKFCMHLYVNVDTKSEDSNSGNTDKTPCAPAAAKPIKVKSYTDSHPSLANSPTSVSIEPPAPTAFHYPSKFNLKPINIQLMRSNSLQTPDNRMNNTPSVNTLNVARAIQSMLHDKQTISVENTIGGNDANTTHCQHDNEPVDICLDIADVNSDDIGVLFKDTSKSVTDNDDNCEESRDNNRISVRVDVVKSVTDIIMEDQELDHSVIRKITINKPKAASLPIDELELSDLLFDISQVTKASNSSLVSLTFTAKKSLRFINYESTNL